jgi:hypothetical protein
MLFKKSVNSFDKLYIYIMGDSMFKLGISWKGTSILSELFFIGIVTCRPIAR